MLVAELPLQRDSRSRNRCDGPRDHDRSRAPRLPRGPARDRLSPVRRLDGSGSRPGTPPSAWPTPAPTRRIPPSCSSSGLQLGVRTSSDADRSRRASWPAGDDLGVQHLTAADPRRHASDEGRLRRGSSPATTPRGGRSPRNCAHAAHAACTCSTTPVDRQPRAAMASYFAAAARGEGLRIRGAPLGTRTQPRAPGAPRGGSAAGCGLRVRTARHARRRDDARAPRRVARRDDPRRPGPPAAGRGLVADSRAPQGEFLTSTFLPRGP